MGKGSGTVENIKVDRVKLTEKDIQEWYGEMFTHAFHVGVFVDCDDKSFTIAELKQQILQNQKLRELVEKSLREGKEYLNSDKLSDEGISYTKQYMFQLQSLLDKAKQVSSTGAGK